MVYSKKAQKCEICKEIVQNIQIHLKYTHYFDKKAIARYEEKYKKNGFSKEKAVV